MLPNELHLGLIVAQFLLLHIDSNKNYTPKKQMCIRIFKKKFQKITRIETIEPTQNPFCPQRGQRDFMGQTTSMFLITL